MRLYFLSLFIMAATSLTMPDMENTADVLMIIDMTTRDSTYQRLTGHTNFTFFDFIEILVRDVVEGNASSNHFAIYKVTNVPTKIMDFKQGKDWQSIWNFLTPSYFYFTDVSLSEQKSIKRNIETANKDAFQVEKGDRPEVPDIIIYVAFEKVSDSYSKQLCHEVYSSGADLAVVAGNYLQDSSFFLCSKLDKVESHKNSFVRDGSAEVMDSLKKMLSECTSTQTPVPCHYTAPGSCNKYNTYKIQAKDDRVEEAWCLNGSSNVEQCAASECVIACNNNLKTTAFKGGGCNVTCGEGQEKMTPDEWNLLVKYCPVKMQPCKGQCESGEENSAQMSTLMQPAETSPPAPKKGMQWWVWAAIAGGGVVLLLVIVLVVVFGFKEKKRRRTRRRRGRRPVQRRIHRSRIVSSRGQRARMNRTGRPNREGQPRANQETLGEMAKRHKVREQELTRCEVEPRPPYNQDLAPQTLPAWVMNNSFGGMPQREPTEEMERLEKEMILALADIEAGKVGKLLPENEPLAREAVAFWQEMRRRPTPAAAQAAPAAHLSRPSHQMRRQ